MNNEEIKQKSEETKLKKTDMYLLAGIIAIGIIMLVYIKLCADKGKYVSISVDGKIIERLKLDEDTTYEVENEYGRNVITIEAQKVSVSEADCQDKICVKHKALSDSSEAIVCLPHKLVVEITQ